MSSRFSAIIPIQQGEEWIRHLLIFLEPHLKPEQTSNEHIEIELKFVLQNHNSNIMQPQDSYKRVSYQAVLWLNNLINCHFKAGFFDAKKFYAMKEFLEKICRENAKKTSNASHNGGDHRTLNFYKILATRFQNSKLKQEDSELRIDINYKGCRYTYSHGRSWEIINKQRLTNYDLMYCSQVVRLTISKETTKWEDNIKDTLTQIFEAAGADKKDRSNVRLKNILKVEKNEFLEISLSEILIIQDPAKHKKLVEMAEMEEALNNYLVDEFANFYSQPINHQKQCLQVQCEITHKGISLLRDMMSQNRRLEAEAFFDTMIQEFCSMFYSDYAIKKQEEVVIADKYRTEMGQDLRVQGRLQNEIGHYMRSQLTQYMQQPLDRS